MKFPKIPKEKNSVMVCSGFWLHCVIVTHDLPIFSRLVKVRREKSQQTVLDHQCPASRIGLMDVASPHLEFTLVVGVREPGAVFTVAARYDAVLDVVIWSSHCTQLHRSPVALKAVLVRNNSPYV